MTHATTQLTAIAAWPALELPPRTAVRITAAVRWGALAVLAVAVPTGLVMAALMPAAAPTSTPLTAQPAAIEAVAPAGLEAPALASLPATAPLDAAPADAAPAEGAAPALPAYFFIDWAAECETECPALVAP